MTLCLCFGDVTEWLDNRLAVEPIGKLVGIMAAAGLATLAAGDEQDRVVPVCKIGDKTHRGTVPVVRRARAEAGAGLRPVSFTQEKFQPATTANRMVHL